MSGRPFLKKCVCVMLGAFLDLQKGACEALLCVFSEERAQKHGFREPVRLTLRSFWSTTDGLRALLCVLFSCMAAQCHNVQVAFARAFSGGEAFP